MTDSDAGIPVERSPALLLLDQVLSAQAPLVERHIERLRRNRPDATPQQIVKRLNSELRATIIGGGAGVGAVAATRKMGLKGTLVISSGEKVAALGAAALYVLSRAELQGVQLDDIERRRTLVMGVLLGNAGLESIHQVAERTGQHWAKHLVKNIPLEKIRVVNNVLGPNFVTKYGTKQGIVVLGRVIPRGVGAVIGGAAGVMSSQTIIKAADLAFGAAPESWAQG